MHYDGCAAELPVGRADAHERIGVACPCGRADSFDVRTLARDALAAPGASTHWHTVLSRIAGLGDDSRHACPSGPRRAIAASRVPAAGAGSIITSTDGGRSFHRVGRDGLEEPAAMIDSIAAATASNLFVQAIHLYRSTDGGAHFARARGGPRTTRFLGFQNAEVGRAVEPAASGSDTIWTTRDGGAKWSASQIR
jgi:hypothetical protein